MEVRLYSRRMADTLRFQWFLWGIKNRQNKELERATLQKGEPLDLILRFVKEVVQRNQGMMKIEGDEKKAKTFISLRFPVERRKVVYYQSVN